MTTTDTPRSKTGLLQRSAIINLVYLVFLFVPWIFVPPGRLELAVAALAVAVFLPVHFWGFRNQGGSLLLPIGLTALIGVATAPFNVGHSVFHVYAAAQSGFQAPRRLSAVAMIASTAVYLASAFFFERPVYEIGFGVLMSVIVWVSCLSHAEEQAAQTQKSREHALDKQQASLHERERIARDLHDLLGHTLTMVALKSDIASRLIESDPAAAKAEIDAINSSARIALQDVRRTLSGLTQTDVDHELQNADAALTSAGIALKVVGLRPQLSAQEETMCGLMIREAVTNIIRHSGATAANITFSDEETGPKITIADNGKGGVVNEGQGLTGLRARIEALGGALSIMSADGFAVSLNLPGRVPA